VAKKTARQTKEFDVTFKHLVEMRPADVLTYVGLAGGQRVQVIDADLSTVLVGADKVLLVGRGTRRFLLHLEFQTGPDRKLLMRLFAYNALLVRRHGLPVWTVLILLKPEANSPRLTGELQIHLPNGRRCHWFEYQIVPVWTKPVASVLTGGLGMLPLAPLCAGAQDNLPEVVRQMRGRIEAEATPDERATLWSATYFLMGLRYPSDLAARFLQGVQGMKDSTTYQATLAEGARKLVLRQGRKRFGPPGREITAALESITDVEQLERLGERLLDVTTWEDLLGQPGPRRQGGRKKPS
jgi:hypothetical protein